MRSRTFFGVLGVCLGILALAGVVNQHLSTSGPIMLEGTISSAPGADVLMHNQPAAKKPGGAPLQFGSRGHILGFGTSSLMVAAADHMVRVELVGGKAVEPLAEAGVSESQTFTNARDRESLGVGNNRKEAQRSAPPLERVTYRDVWDGVTVTYRKAGGAIVESAYRIEPGADSDEIRLRYNRPIEIEGNGELVLSYDRGEIRESVPVAWQEIRGTRDPVPVAFRRLGEREVGFAVGDYDNSYPLFVDPLLTWNTFLGGSAQDEGLGIRVDSSKNVYVMGISQATWGSPKRAFSSSYDVFAAKLDRNGNLLWNTFLGGGGWDGGGGIAVDGSGNVYVSGDSPGKWGSPRRAFTARTDAFVAKLDNNGNLLWNTFLGGSQYESGGGIVVDGSGSIYVVGRSSGKWGSPKRSYSSSSDAFAAKLDNGGNLTWNTFLGGSGIDNGYAIAVGGGGVYVAGMSSATWGSPRRAYSGWDAFAAKLNSNGSMIWNTFLGGSEYDSGHAIAADGSGNVYMAGYSYKTWGSPKRAFTSTTQPDAFAAKLNSNGNLTWNTFLGGDGYDRGYGIKVDGSGNIYVGGESGTRWGSPKRAYSKFGDAFAAKLDGNGNLAWNTFVGGNGVEYGRAIAVDGNGDAYIVGSSGATWGSPKRAFTSVFDAFVAKIPTSGGTAAAGFGVSLWADNLNPEKGNCVTFTATAKNNGPDPASGLGVKIMLPTGLTYISASPSQGTYSSSTGIWDIGSLEKDLSVTLTLTAKVIGSGKIAITASSLAADFKGSIGSNNAATVAINVPPGAPSVTKIRR